MKHRLAIAACSIAAVAFCLWWFFGDEAADQAHKLASSGAAAQLASKDGGSSLVSTSMSGAAQTNSGAPLSPQGQRERDEKLAQARARYERAAQVFSTYRDATRYPHESRSIADAPDQVRPFDPVVEEKTMRNERGEPVKGITL